MRPLAPADAPVRAERRIDVWLDGGWRKIGLFQRAHLSPGHAFYGPAVVAQEDATTIVPEGFAAKVDSSGNLVLDRVNSP
jgi:N-methylhydantoinase A